MDDEEIMNLNLNRLSMIKQIPKKDNKLQAEYDLRIKWQNEYKTAEGERAKNSVAKKVSESLNKNMIKTINSYMKKK